MPVTEQQGKLSSMQCNGRLLRPVIGMAYRQHAELDHGHPGQVIFMSDGVQTGNFAIKGVVVPAAQGHQ